MQEALYWEKAGEQVHCLLCPHDCTIPPRGSGRCQVRKNICGKLWAVNYGEVSGLALDPIEKKPLYHFFPGSLILSAGSRGCNLDCGFCQNWASVRGEYPVQTLSPVELADLAAATKSRGNIGIAFTYTEPLVWYEYVLAGAKEARRRGLKTVLVTNGYIRLEPWLQLLEHIDALNIDLKAFSNRFYRANCKGSLQPVKEAIAAAVGKCHVEVTTLLIQGENAGAEEVESLSTFLATLNRQIPLHLSRYYPARQWQQPATPPDLIEDLAEIARQKLDFVYTGNLPGSYSAGTYSPQCGQLLIQRGTVTKVFLSQRSCPRCKYQVPISAYEE
ncbi:MAG: AmmeMemoRadiSam system radical SAM enzyme [Firmicutes bacterium]|nr:AmmeMemoRadiSam system radical SAM enzyme [Bacillota bacterium]